MLRFFVFCVLAVAIGVDSSAQSRCAEAKVSEDVFDQRPEFHATVAQAKSIFVGVYHNPVSALIAPPPPDSVDRVRATIRKWPLANRDEEAMLRKIRMDLRAWGRYRLESNLSKADLILVAKLGRNKGDPIPREGNVDIPLQFLWDDSLHLYAAKLRPGLVWCGNQAGGLHGIRSFPLVTKLETDIYAIPERR